MIKAPYNFVPLSDKVFFPPWANQVSHDVPFSDGESGEIEVTITAKSPIFVRNHEVNGDKYYTTQQGKKISTEFCNYKGKYYIPGSSVKGMVRNIVEIISFARLQTENKKFAYRDFNEPYYKQKLLDNTNSIRMGWLRNKQGFWEIEDLGKCDSVQNRIKYEEMNISQKDTIKNRRLAEEKYALVENKNPKHGDRYIVFTGKVGQKNREFIFPETKKSNTRYLLEENDIVVKSFKEAYYLDKTNENKLWRNVFRERFAKGEKIPVFFIVNNDSVESFGLSMLYKLPYKFSIYDGMPKVHTENKEKCDLAELIFGYTKEVDGKQKALKGRVQFSHLITSQNKSEQRVRKTLSSPRAGYYPMYSKDGTSMDYPCRISGWKRYPVHQQANNASNGSCQSSHKQSIDTCFEPLPSGTVFKGKIRFHNLKKVEIGALLTSLSLGLYSNREIYYSLGMVKPFGFGKVQINIGFSNSKFKQQEYIDLFKDTMNNDNAWIGGKPFKKWEMSENIKELLAMMTPNNDNYLTYGQAGQKGFEYYGQFKHSNREKRIQYSAYAEYIQNRSQEQQRRRRITKKIQVRKLIEELGITLEQIVQFVEQENIDAVIENEYSLVSEEIAEMIKEYI